MSTSTLSHHRYPTIDACQPPPCHDGKHCPMDGCIDGVATGAHSTTSAARIHVSTVTLRRAGVRSGRMSTAPAADGGVRLVGSRSSLCEPTKWAQVGAVQKRLFALQRVFAPRKCLRDETPCVAQASAICTPWGCDLGVQIAPLRGAKRLTTFAKTGRESNTNSK